MRKGARIAAGLWALAACPGPSGGATTGDDPASETSGGTSGATGQGPGGGSESSEGHVSSTSGEAPTTGASTGASTEGPPDPPLPAIYVGPEGDDSAPGTKEAPVRTFARALELWQPGWEVLALAGVYSEQLEVPLAGTAADPVIVRSEVAGAAILDAAGSPAGQPILLTGSHIEVAGFEVRGSDNQCVKASGQGLVLRDLRVHDCVSHGVEIDGQDVLAEGLTIHTTVLENEGEQGAWGSALKLSAGAAGVVLRRNLVYHNWGEGIAATRAVDVEIAENRVFDNYSVNIYIDNSYGVLVDANWSSCTADSGFERAGSRAAGIALAEEQYEGWGAQLADVEVRNNLVVSCDRGVIYYGADVPGGGLDHVTIRFNTLWDSVDTAISTAAEPAKTTGSEIAYNLVQQPTDAVAYIDDPAGIDLHDNFWVGPVPEDWRNCTGPGDLTGDPKLAFPPGDTAKSLRLAADSPARDRAPGAVPLDLEGKERGPQADLGAIEYGDPDAPSPVDERWP